jgi:hypothetical protein
VPYAPRKNLKRTQLLLREFERRAGDPNLGGSTRKPIMTAYRQDVLRCVLHLSTHGASRIKDIRIATGVDRAPGIFRDNVYQWFQREARGVYGLTESGATALKTFDKSVQEIRSSAK